MRIAIIFGVFSVLLALAPAEASPRQDILAGPLQGSVLNVLDGDTVSVRLHVWIGQDIETHVRIGGIDTPELKGKCEKERELALEAQQALVNLLSDNQIRLYNIRLEKYAGRVLAEAETLGGINIREHLIAQGLARPYAGKKRLSWCS